MVGTTYLEQAHRHRTQLQALKWTLVLALAFLTEVLEEAPFSYELGRIHAHLSSWHQACQLRTPLWTQQLPCNLASPLLKYSTRDNPQTSL